MRTRMVVLILMALAGAGLFLLGRMSAPDGEGYADGVREGRAEQASLGRDATIKSAFDDGYRAGADDVFGGYDGGWGFQPYLVGIVKGSNGITYRIGSRTEMRAGVNYRLCPDGRGICHD